MQLTKKIASSSWVLKIFGIKSLYQILYLLFVLVVMKDLSVDDYGTYSYLLAVILFFSSVSLLGLPIYLQKKMARQEALNVNYFFFPVFGILSGIAAVIYLLANLGILLKICVLIIIAYNLLTNIIVALNDGRGNYLNQYKFLLLVSIWMLVCVIKFAIFKIPLSIHFIFSCWAFNCIIGFLAALRYLRALNQSIILINVIQTSYLGILADLLLIYSANMIDVFVKFYDRYLAKHSFGMNFIGNYSFNAMIVVTVYAFFIRPINSFFLSQLSKNSSSLEASAKLIKNYYCLIFCIYLSIYLFYSMGEEKILLLLGLQKYNNTLYLFKIIFLNTLFYLSSYPFIMLTALSENRRNKLTYCFGSLLIFNLPGFFLCFYKVENIFLFGFLFAYALHFLLSIIISREYFIYFFNMLLRDIYHSIKYQAERGYAILVKYGK